MLTHQEKNMTDDRIAGTARNFGGKVQEGFGKVTGDAKSEFQGKVEQAMGSAQDLYGQAKDVASDAAQAVQQGAKEADDYVRKFVEQRPYTTAIGALVLGWVIGHMGRSRNY
jgi:uncharacterized protein YjbJ (UPF0337 family)